MTQPVLPPLSAPPRVRVCGVSEWEHLFFFLPDPAVDPERPVEDCIDAHLALGMDQIAWNCGRSTLDYRSELAGAASVRTLTASDPGWLGFRARMWSRFCPLRRAIAYGRRRGVSILGRLGMNRNYGAASYPEFTSRFAAGHPEYHERNHAGAADPTRLCYAIEAVRQERIAVLSEIQRIGVDGLVLDFCRQPPIAWYHPALVESFEAAHGRDPRTIESGDPAAFEAWFRHRAAFVTVFMRNLRLAVRRQEAETGRPCPIIARVPSASEWLLLACGLDMETWLREDLADALMLSPLIITRDPADEDPAFVIGLARRRGKPCYGGVGSLGLMSGHHVHTAQETAAWFRAQPAYERAHAQYAAGAGAMSLYQSETLVLQPHLRELIGNLGDREFVAAQAARPRPQDVDAEWRRVTGADWHSSHPAVNGLGPRSYWGLAGNDGQHTIL